jgi:aerotaxis receptor
MARTGPVLRGIDRADMRQHGAVLHDQTSQGAETMRDNQPVTGREHPLPAGATLLSTTDLQSRITYANAAFVAASGFAQDALVGQPHNVVRHPDMPPEAFADMWATLRAGDAWSAIVKNRRRDGDHYWVRANATPVRRGGAVVGYMSVRTAPSRAEIDTAEALYRRLRAGTAGALCLHKGIVVRGGWLAWTSLGRTMPLSARIRLALGTVTGAALAALVGVRHAHLAAEQAGGTSAEVFAIGAAAVIAGALVADRALQRQVTRPLRTILAQARTVASGQPGDLSRLDRVDEIGMLMRAVGQAGLNLRALVDDVAGQVAGVGRGSAEIASGTQDLSARTEQTAASLQQTASSMEQMAATVDANATNARDASELASTASGLAARGGEVFARAIASMSEITGASRQIGEIVAVIDTIAFQTNILALNAAVEAARAGEHGRGFAVVAAEVRALSQRSAESARQIRSLIDASVRAVEAGSAQVGTAGDTMQEIVDGVRRVATLIGTIADAAREQGAGIAQVNEAVAQIDRATQQNAALVEQSSAAAESLRDQSRGLVEAVRVYGAEIAD